MAIQPRFADRILAGEKRVEFRKVPFRFPVSHVIIYSSGPVCRIVGFFEIDGLDVASPEELWKRYLPVAGVGAEDFQSYFGSAERGVAIRIGRVFRLSAPMSIESLLVNAHPPQSFCYVDTSVLESLAAAASQLDRHELGEVGKRSRSLRQDRTSVRNRAASSSGK